MHALGCRPAGRIRACLDPKLMALDLPFFAWAQRTEQTAAERKHALHRRTFDDLCMHRLEPALDAADQRVVVDALVVRLVRLQRDFVFAGTRRQRGMAAPPIAMAVGQVSVQLKIVPAFGETLPVGQRTAIAEQRPHVICRNERESLSLDAIAQRDRHARECCRFSGAPRARIANIAIPLNTAPAMKVCGAPN